MSVKLLKQYKNLVTNVGNFTDGQVEISDLTATDSDDSLELICLTVSPKNGPYRGGKFAFTLTLKSFPTVPPEVVCQTRIYHPNIDLDGIVCLNLIGDLWTPTTSMEDVVQGILFLFYQPNINDPISEFFTGNESYKLFKWNVQRTLRGGYVQGVTFERNLPEDFDVQIAYDEIEDEPWPIQWDSESGSDESESITLSDIGYGSLDELEDPTVNDIQARLVVIEQLISQLRNGSSPSLDEPAGPALVGSSLVVHRMINRFLFLPEWLFNTATAIFHRSCNIVAAIWTMSRNRILNVSR